MSVTVNHEKLERLKKGQRAKDEITMYLAECFNKAFDTERYWADLDGINRVRRGKLEPKRRKNLVIAFSLSFVISVVCLGLLWFVYFMSSLLPFFSLVCIWMGFSMMSILMLRDEQDRRDEKVVEIFLHNGGFSVYCDDEDTSRVERMLATNKRWDEFEIIIGGE